MVFIKIASYNLYGLNNGLSMVQQICSDKDVFFVAIQEHWLSNDKLYKLSNVDPNFSYFALSSMNSVCESKIFRGRPFGGVGILWRSIISNRIKIIQKDSEGRCLAISFDAGDGHIICIVCVYLPCFSDCNKYFTQLEFYLGFIENVIQNYDEIIVLGDFNFPCKPGHPAFDKVNSVFSQYDISHCDNLLTNPLDSQFSYVEFASWSKVIN